MYTALVAPSTLPAAMMVPAAAAGIGNLIVPTAVSATHVAFSAVRLEPTWMSTGTAAGYLAHLTMLHSDPSPSAGSDGDLVGRVRVVDLQRLVVESGGQPLLYFSDLTVGQPGWASLQRLGPHVLEPADGFEARPNRPPSTTQHLLPSSGSALNPGGSMRAGSLLWQLIRAVLCRHTAAGRRSALVGIRPPRRERNGRWAGGNPPCPSERSRRRSDLLV